MIFAGTFEIDGFVVSLYVSFCMQVLLRFVPGYVAFQVLLITLLQAVFVTVASV